MCIRDSSMNETVGFPTAFKFSNVKGSVIVPTAEGTSDVDLVSNVVALHKFLYGDEAYVPSSTVQDISAKIAEIVSGLGALEDTQVITPETENTTNDTIIFENNGNGWSDNSGDYVDPGTGDGSGGGDWTDPGTGDGSGDWEDPGTGDGSGDWEDPGTGDGSGDGSGGGDWTDPGTGDGSGDGSGGGDWTDPGIGEGGGSVDGGDGSTDAGGSVEGGDGSSESVGGDSGEVVPGEAA